MRPTESNTATKGKSIPKTLLWFLVIAGVTLALGSAVIVRSLHRQKGAPEVVAAPVATEPVVLSHDVTSAESRRKWGPEVPHGTQVLDNVTFVCDGGLRTAGLRVPKHPGAVLGIPIHHKATRIHLLQAAENSPGNFIGRLYGGLRFHFANGQSRDYYLRFGVHGRDWLQLRHQLGQTVSDPNTTVAWVAENPARKVWVRLFHTALESPFPNEEITTMDAISPLGDGNLLLFAISTDTSPEKLQASSEEEWPKEGWTMAFSLQDMAGVPIYGGSVQWKAVVGRGAVDFPAFQCDSAGRIHIDFPTTAITQINYTAVDQQGLTITGSVAMPDSGWPPTQQVAVVFSKKVAQ